MKIKTTLVGLTAAAAMATPAFADYPERAIELTIPAGAGGGTDTSARKLAILLEEALGQSIAVLNVGGGGGRPLLLSCCFWSCLILLLLTMVALANSSSSSSSSLSSSSIGNLDLVLLVFF